VQIQEHHIKLSFLEDAGSFRASGEAQCFHAGGIQHFSNQLANKRFIVDDQATPLHVILRILTMARRAIEPLAPPVRVSESPGKSGLVFMDGVSVCLIAQPDSG
jgi:hypothetical protein